MSVRLASACVLAFIGFLAIPAPALADDPFVPPACMVKDAKRITIGSFSFTAAQLQQFKRNQQLIMKSYPDSATLGQSSRQTQKARLIDLIEADSHFPPEICGIVDEWHYAAMMAYKHCNSLVIGAGQAYFSITQPAIFNDPNHHHTRYQQGVSGSTQVLEGTCHVCLPPSPRPTKKNSVKPRIAVPPREL